MAEKFDSNARTTILTLPTAGRDHIEGPIDAPIKLLEYGDFECPFCGRAYSFVKAIQRELGENLCFAFRHFPLTNVHPHSEQAAEAAEAAGAQGKFWKMHELLFENQNALEGKNLVRYATILALDVERLKIEIYSRAYSERIREDFMAGVRGGVNGTPTFFINGQRYDGAVEALLGALSRAAA